MYENTIIKNVEFLLRMRREQGRGIEGVNLIGLYCMHTWR
jgi:hypothetical protein